jgi:hypothetical protein
MILRAAPSAISIVGDMLRVAVTQGLHDEQMLKHLSKALNVGMHGWPLDPIVRRRLRVERFYQFNAVPIDTRRIETALASAHTEDELLQTLYRKYQRNEIGESLDPDVALGETLLHVFACANPAMQEKVPNFVLEQASSGLSHGEYLEEVCRVLGVCTDGWPLDPDERLRKRLESFYRRNDPKKMDRIERLMSRDFTDEQILIALYEKYGVDELGQPVQNERMIREQLTRLLQPTRNEKKVDELVKYMKESRLTDAELLHAVRKMLSIGDDGLPLDAADRVRTRVRMFFRANATDAVVGPTSILQPSSHVGNGPQVPPQNDPDDGSPSAGTPIRNEPPNFSISRPRPNPQVLESAKRPRLKSNPPLLTPAELAQLHEGNAVLDELLVDELRTIRAKLQDHEHHSSSDAASAPIDSAGGSSPLFTRLTRRVSKYFGSKADGADAASTAPPAAHATAQALLDSITPQEEDALMEVLCRRFQRNEVGEVVLPKKERAAIRQEFISYIERFVVEPVDIVRLATSVSELNLSQSNMWEVLRRQLDHLEEHPLHTTFRENLHTMFQRCAPKDAGRIDSMILCMFEDGLSHQEVLQTIMAKYGVDAEGWPLEPMRRRRVQLTMLLQRHDPSKVPLIDSLFMTMPAVSDTDDRLYRTMCETYGADELGRPVARRHSAPVYQEEGGYSGVSPVRSGSAPDSSASSSRGVSPGGLSGKNGGGPSFITSLQSPFVGTGSSPGAVGTPVSDPQHSMANHDKQQLSVGGTSNSGRAHRRFQDVTPQQRTNSFAKMPSSLTLNQPQAKQTAQPVEGLASASSFYGPLRDLRARDHWDGNAAAADVAAVIGEQFLKELRDKYGGPDEPKVGANGERPPEMKPSHHSNLDSSPQELRPAYHFEYKSMKPSPLEAYVSNPFEAMRHSARSTIEQIHSDAHAVEVRRRKWGDQKQLQAPLKAVPTHPTDPSLFTYLTQTRLPPVDPEVYLPSDEGRNLRHRNVALGVKGAALGGIPWLSDEP